MDVEIITDSRLSKIMDIVTACKSQFEMYSNNHYRKDKIDKARTNSAFALMCEQALSLLAEEEKGKTRWQR